MYLAHLFRVRCIELPFNVLLDFMMTRLSLMPHPSVSRAQTRTAMKQGKLLSLPVRCHYLSADFVGSSINPAAAPFGSLLQPVYWTAHGARGNVCHSLIESFLLQLPNAANCTTASPISRPTPYTAACMVVSRQIQLWNCRFHNFCSAEVCRRRFIIIIVFSRSFDGSLGRVDGTELRAGE